MAGKGIRKVPGVTKNKFNSKELVIFNTQTCQKDEGDGEREPDYCTSVSIHKICDFLTVPAFNCIKKHNRNYSSSLTLPEVKIY